MSIPLLETVPKSQNQRVEGFEVANEDAPVSYRLTDATSSEGLDGLIWAAYRQIFSEHLTLQRYRQTFLESQLRNRAISVQDFIRGLGKSEVYRELVAATNSNYRLVDLTFKRFLGRSTYGKDEQIAWSIVIGTQGLDGFIDAVVDSDEYQENFGDDIVPYQRRRMEGRPFNLVNPRYSDYWRSRESALAGSSYYQARPYRPGRIDTQVVRQAIPFNFLKMAQGMLAPEINYQRTIEQTRSRVASLTLPETSRQGTAPQTPVRRTEVALPYRYLQATPKA
jgi:phycobilisome rod-core linker protein